jgi:hypothetical protein
MLSYIAILFGGPVKSSFYCINIRVLVERCPVCLTDQGISGMQTFVPLERCTACLLALDGVWTYRAISQGSKCQYMIGRDLL